MVGISRQKQPELGSARLMGRPGKAVKTERSLLRLTVDVFSSEVFLGLELGPSGPLDVGPAKPNFFILMGASSPVNVTGPGMVLAKVKMWSP